MNDCIFCKIIKNEVPTEVIFENDEFLAFPAKDQTFKGHILVIPKKHFENIFDFEKESLQRLMGVAQIVAKDMISNGATGINLLHASGKDAQQSVFHFHLHVVPRYPNDGVDMWLRNIN